jgi:hypothetical protein
MEDTPRKLWKQISDLRTQIVDLTRYLEQAVTLQTSTNSIVSDQGERIKRLQILLKASRENHADLLASVGKPTTTDTLKPGTPIMIGFSTEDGNVTPFHAMIIETKHTKHGVKYRMAWYGSGDYPDHTCSEPISMIQLLPCNRVAYTDRHTAFVDSSWCVYPTNRMAE